MDDQQSRNQGESLRGYDTPGEDKVITNTSEAVGSPSVTGRQRVEAPDPFIGGDVNEAPGSDNPAREETERFAEGKATTADVLRAREEPEEAIDIRRGGDVYDDKYADQTTDPDASGQLTYRETQDSDPEEAIYERREFDETSEPSEIDMLGLRTPNAPSEDSGQP
jgi:hypothetical protein